MSALSLNSIVQNFPFLGSPDKPQKKTTKVILVGSQEGKIGPTHYSTMVNTFQKLKAFSEKGVQFNPMRLVHHLFGGTCTAMAFGFIKDYLDNPMTDLHDKTISIMANYTKSCQTFRAQQIAFNTIEYSSTPSDDLKLAKAQSLANFYDLKFDHVSTDLHWKDILNSPDLLKKEIEILPEGIYFLRILRLEDNYKGERWGHSTVYIKDKIQGDYFYDPNYGLTEIAENETADFLMEHFEKLNDTWLVNNPRFYKIKV